MGDSGTAGYGGGFFSRFSIVVWGQLNGQFLHRVEREAVIAMLCGSTLLQQVPQTCVRVGHHLQKPEDCQP